jgi:serine/threonine protein kinase
VEGSGFARIESLRSSSNSKQRYALKGEIGRGGMGAILEIFDRDLRRHLAMKVVLGSSGQTGGNKPELESQQLVRFLEEAQVTGQLDHPGVVPVHELGVDADGRVYFTMRLVKGQDLSKVFAKVHEGDPDWSRTRVLGVLSKVCEAMSYAHEKGVVHRDLKPANVMVGRHGAVYVMDWGLARVEGREDSHDLRLQEQAESISVFEEALPYSTEALEGERRVLGNDHRSTVKARANLRTLHERLLAAQLEEHGVDHPLTLTAQRNQAIFFANSNQEAEAEALLLDCWIGIWRIRGKSISIPSICSTTWRPCITSKAALANQRGCILSVSPCAMRPLGRATP